MQQIKLWEREIPYFKEEADTPNNMTFYPVPTWHALPTVVVFPGGGYSHRAAHEGEAIAQYYNAQGFHACVVDYRVKPNAYPAPLCDAQRAVKLLRAKANDLRIDPDRIYTIGFSAGSHLAAYEAMAEDCALYGDEADEADVGPLHGAVSHEAVVADGAGNFNGVAVHQTGLNDGVAGGADSSLGQRSTDQGKTGTDDNDLVLLDVLGDGVSLHFLFGILGIISHFYITSLFYFRCVLE